jgi:asparagine synthase (glutamine-hydrolysing)
VGDWLRVELKELMCDTLTSRRFRERGYFNLPKIDEMVDEHLTGRRNRQFQLWNLLVLELWHRMLVDTDRGMAA